MDIVSVSLLNVLCAKMYNASPNKTLLLTILRVPGRMAFTKRPDTVELKRGGYQIVTKYPA